jgi:hypothetical protein
MWPYSCPIICIKEGERLLFGRAHVVHAANFHRHIQVVQSMSLNKFRQDTLGGTEARRLPVDGIVGGAVNQPKNPAFSQCSSISNAFSRPIVQPHCAVPSTSSFFLFIIQGNADTHTAPSSNTYFFQIGTVALSVSII